MSSTATMQPGLLKPQHWKGGLVMPARLLSANNCRASPSQITVSAFL